MRTSISKRTILGTMMLAGVCWAQPVISKVDPQFVNAGASTFGMYIDGTGFAAGSTGYWNSTPLATTYVSSARIAVTVPASLAATPATVGLQVGNPTGPTVIYSNSFGFVVSSNVFSIYNVLPKKVVAGDPSFTMGLSGFVLPADSVVQWNGTPLTTTFVDSTQLFATVPANLYPTPGVATIQVVSKGISSNFGYITVQSADLVPSIAQDQIFAQGRDVSYTIGLSKPGVWATVGAINATVTIPTGLTARSISGTNWTCQQPAGPCTYSGAIAGGSGSGLTLKVHVASDAASPQVLSATFSGGGSSTTTITKSTSILPPGALIHADVSPAASSGTSQTFSFQYLTDLGASAFNYVDVLINSALDGRTACYFAYVPSSNANAILLVNDGGDSGGPFSQITLNGGNTKASNDQCTIFESGSSASSSGNTLTLTLNISFNASFAGNKVIYMAGFGAPEPSGWLTMGVYGVTPLPVTNPGATGMIPSSGSTSNAVLRYTFQDATNALNLQTAWALINTAIDGRGACYAAYYRPGNLVFLYPDNGDGSQATSMVLTGNNTISNSQCTINAAGSLVSVVGNQMIVNLNTTFKSGFTGPKGVWTAVQTLGGQTSPWQPVGAWRVP